MIQKIDFITEYFRREKELGKLLYSGKCDVFYTRPYVVSGCPVSTYSNVLSFQKMFSPEKINFN